MAFENLSDRLQMALRRVTGRGKLNEKDIDEMMRDVRLSLLEADVNYRVVKEFTQNVKEQALGEKILHGLNPGQQVVKIVFDELKRIMGDDASGINLKMQGMSVIMTMGLQGAGKTTAIGKLANYLRKYEKKNPMLIAADIYRPAAVDQLVQIGKQLNIFVFEEGVNKRAWDIVANGLAYAKEHGYDTVIIDTAGRLHIDEDMMEELVRVKQVAKPDEVLLVKHPFFPFRPPLKRLIVPHRFQPFNRFFLWLSCLCGILLFGNKIFQKPGNFRGGFLVSGKPAAPPWRENMIFREALGQQGFQHPNGLILFHPFALFPFRLRTF